MITLTNENYYTKTADIDYMSVSQFKDFAGTLGMKGCESRAMRTLNGEYVPPVTKPLLVGSYVDAYFEGTLDAFKAENPGIFKTTGDKGLKAEYIQAEQMIKRLEADPLCMSYLSGEKQKIMTAKLFGVDWKIKMDSYKQHAFIADLKTVKNFEPVWSTLLGRKLDFIRYMGYDIQGAIYQKVVEIMTGEKLPFYDVCVSKTNPADILVVEITQQYLDAALAFVESHIQRIVDVKTGISTPVRCNSCEDCVTTKVLDKPVPIETLFPQSDSDPIPDDDAGDEPPMFTPISGYTLF